MIIRHSIPSLSGDHSWASFTWPTHTPARRETLELNSEEFRVVDGHRVKKCAFWKEFLPRLLDLSKYQFTSYTLFIKCLNNIKTLNNLFLSLYLFLWFCMIRLLLKCYFNVSLQTHVPEKKIISHITPLIELWRCFWFDFVYFIGEIRWFDFISA